MVIKMTLPIIKKPKDTIKSDEWNKLVAGGAYYMDTTGDDVWISDNDVKSTNAISAWNGHVRSFKLHACPNNLLKINLNLRNNGTTKGWYRLEVIHEDGTYDVYFDSMISSKDFTFIINNCRDGDTLDLYLFTEDENVTVYNDYFKILGRIMYRGIEKTF